MYIDAAYCYRPSRVVCPPVGLSVTAVSPVKTVELIEIPLGFRTRVVPRKRVLDGVCIPAWEGGNLNGEMRWPNVKYSDSLL